MLLCFLFCLFAMLFLWFTLVSISPRSVIGTGTIEWCPHDRLSQDQIITGPDYTRQLNKRLIKHLKNGNVCCSPALTRIIFPETRSKTYIIQKRRTAVSLVAVHGRRNKTYVNRFTSRYFTWICCQSILARGMSLC